MRVRDFFAAPAVWPQVIRAKNTRLRAATRPSGSASEDFRASPRGGYRHLLSVLNCFRRRADVTMRSSSCIAGADTFICVLASDIERIAKFAEIKLVSEIAPERSDTVSHLASVRHTTVSMTNAADRVEIITSVQRRRRWPESPRPPPDCAFGSSRAKALRQAPEE